MIKHHIYCADCDADMQIIITDEIQLVNEVKKTYGNIFEYVII